MSSNNVDAAAATNDGLSITGNVNMHRRQALFNALKREDVKALKKYLAAGTRPGDDFAVLNDPNIREPNNEKQSTLLHWACYLGNLSMVRLLLAHPHIDVNAVETDGKTPLHWAAFEGFENVVDELLTTMSTLFPKPEGTPANDRLAATDDAPLYHDGKKRLNVGLRDSLNHTAAALARMNGHFEVARKIDESVGQMASSGAGASRDHRVAVGQSAREPNDDVHRTSSSPTAVDAEKRPLSEQPVSAPPLAPHSVRSSVSRSSSADSVPNLLDGLQPAPLRSESRNVDPATSAADAITTEESSPAAERERRRAGRQRKRQDWYEQLVRLVSSCGDRSFSSQEVTALLQGAFELVAQDVTGGARKRKKRVKAGATADGTRDDQQQGGVPTESALIGDEDDDIRRSPATSTEHRSVSAAVGGPSSSSRVSSPAASTSGALRTSRRLDMASRARTESLPATARSGRRSNDRHEGTDAVTAEIVRVSSRRHHDALLPPMSLGASSDDYAPATNAPRPTPASFVMRWLPAPGGDDQRQGQQEEMGTNRSTAQGVMDHDSGVFHRDDGRVSRRFTDDTNASTADDSVKGPLPAHEYTASPQTAEVGEGRMAAARKAFRQQLRSLGPPAIPVRGRAPSRESHVERWSDGSLKPPWRPPSVKAVHRDVLEIEEELRQQRTPSENHHPHFHDPMTHPM